MKTIRTHSTTEAIEILKVLTVKDIDDSHHWIGFNSVRLDSAETVEYVQTKVLSQRHLTINHYPEDKRMCVDIGLSGRNTLHIDLK